eukprot:s304_g58.t2
MYQQKVELVLAAWPKTKITELVMRLILNCQGSAFAKLQLHQTELMENDEKSVKRLVELLGGHWGRIGLERQYEEAEQALFNTTQLRDESNDSYLARSDIAWSKFLSQKLSMSDLQAFVLLRGSTLSSEEKKRVVLEADNSLEGKLTVNRVSESVRLLGASFFQEMTGQKSGAKQKVYSVDALVTEHGDDEDLGFTAQDDITEDDFVECLIGEGDDDATLVADFEAAATEVLQDDPELASAFSAYTEARRRLSEKFKNRGFWSTSTRTSSQSSKGKFGSAKGSGKRKSWSQKPRRSLQDRILNSYCRNCNRKGHWKAECPYKSSGGQNVSVSAGGSTGNPSVPATTVTVDQHDDVLPFEFLDLPDAQHGAHNDALPIYMQLFNPTRSGNRKLGYHSGIHGESTGDSLVTSDQYPTAHARLKAWGFRTENQEPAKKRLAQTLLKCPHVPGRHHPSVSAVTSQKGPTESDRSCQPLVSEATVCFATHGPYGILDLGASKTVIGSDHVAELIRSLDAEIRQRLTRCTCNITFRFGNQGTLASQHALVVPIGSLKLKIAIVPGATPFLMSNSLMRALGARIDCFARKLSSPLLQADMPLQLTPKGLFLVDLNNLVRLAQTGNGVTDSASAETSAETFMSMEPEAKPSGASRQRLRALQITSATQPESLDHLTLEELAPEIIAFGQKHQGKSFEEAWGDQEWVQFMISRYQTSTKEAHRRFLRYVELKVEDMESQQTVQPRTNQPVVTARLQARPKPMPKSIATPSHISSLDGDEDWDVEPETYSPEIMGHPPPIPMAENMAALQTRMLHMETALSRVIQHIEDQAMQNQAMQSKGNVNPEGN